MLMNMKKKTKPCSFQNWLPILILVLLVLLYFSPVILKGRIIFPDLLDYYEPWNDYTQNLPYRFSHLKSDFIDALLPKLNLVKESIAEKNFSLWSDTIDLGKPVIHTALEFVLMPIYAFVWILPTEIGFTIAIILKALLGAFGMYYWLTDLKVRSGVAVAVSVVYVFSGFNLSWFLGNASIVGQITPWAFLFVHKIYDSQNSKKIWRNTVALASVYFFLIISGFVAGAGYVIYFSAFYILFLFIIDFFRSRTSIKERIVLNIRPGLFVLLAIILGVGLSSIKLLPTLEWIDFIDVGYRQSYSSSHLSIRNLAQLVFPNYYGNPVYSNWFGPGNWNETSSYVTVLLLFLAPLGFWEALKEGNKKITIIGILTSLIFLIVWGISPLLKLVSNLPVFNSSSSTRLLLLFDFFLCSLGAYSLEKMLKTHQNKMNQVWLGMSFTVILISIIRTFINIQSVNLKALNLFDNMIFRFLTSLPALIFMGVFILIIFLWDKKALSEKAFILITGALLLLDIFQFTFLHIPMVPKGHFFPDTKITQYLQENQGDGRTIVFDGMFMISGSQLYYGINSVVTHNLHRQPEKELIDQFSENAWATPTAPMMRSKRTNFDSPIFEFLGVKFIVVTAGTTIDDSGWVLVFDEPSEGRIYENQEYVDQKYWFSSNVKAYENTSDFFSEIEEVADFSTIFVESGIEKTANSQSSPILVEVNVDTNDYNALKLCTEYPGILTVRESYWPGWTAEVNGVETKVIEVNHIFRGIKLGPGCSTIIERYQPPSFKLGLRISLITLIIIIITSLGLFVLEKEKTNKNKTNGFFD